MKDMVGRSAKRRTAARAQGDQRRQDQQPQQHDRLLIQHFRCYDYSTHGLVSAFLLMCWFLVFFVVVVWLFRVFELLLVGLD